MANSELTESVNEALVTSLSEERLRQLAEVELENPCDCVDVDISEGGGSASDIWRVE